MPVDYVGVSEHPEEPADNAPDLVGVDEPKKADAPIDRLKPGGDLHQRVLDKLLEMIRMSSNKMNGFYDRWRAAELQYQAYLKTETFEQLKRSSNKTRTPPEIITITVPYTYASLQTIVTYLMHTFCGRSPMFQVGSYRGDQVQRARNMETILQFGGDHERVVRKLFQFFLDGEMYNLSIMRVTWKVENRRRTIYKPSNIVPIFGGGSPVMQPVKESAVTYEGNEVRNIDPFRFFPDPRVPFEEVGEKGEFVFWSELTGKCELRKAEKNGLVKWVDAVPERQYNPNDSQSERGRLAGAPRMGIGDYDKQSYELHQGSVEIVPSQWGLGDSDEYEKWLFTIANKQQIIQAEPLDDDHDRHPVIVGEPHSVGYEVGGASGTDMVAPFQEMLSWMFNTHMFNVRAALNNTFVVNPQMVDLEDMKKPGPGRVIKTLPAAFGQDIKNAFYQVPIADVTAQHVTDMQVVQRFADNVSATNDNLRGVINTGGRKSATEVRQSGEAGASRLGAKARFISAQSICPFAEMQTINIQQYMSQEVWLKVLGDDGMKAPVRLGPEDVSGDFYFPVHDGTLPLDRVALLEVWRQIFTVIMQTPGLAQVFDAVGIFQYIADLGGAKNLSTFKVQGASNEMVDQALQAGNMAPASQLKAAGPSVPRPGAPP